MRYFGLCPQYDVLFCSHSEERCDEESLFYFKDNLNLKPQYDDTWQAQIFV